MYNVALREGLITREKEFVFAGRSCFTVKNEETGNRFTYKVFKKIFPDEKVMFFVSFLRGSDNTSDYTYLGTVFENGVFKSTKKSRFPDSQAFKVFEWFNKRLWAGTLPNFINVYHMGRCGRCGKELTVPESIESGFGPECIKKVGGKDDGKS
jgi:hypothetical protein